MIEHAPPRSRLGLVGGTTLFLGALDFIRCIPEVISATGMNSIYFAVLCFDALLAILAMIAGAGLRRERAWGWEPSSLAWGALSGNSATMLLRILPGFLQELRRGPPWRELLIFSPRMLFYVLSLALMPYVLRALLTSPREGRPGNLTLWTWLSVGVVCGAGMALFILELPK